MKTIKEYKGVALIYLGLALINVVLMISVENPVNQEKVYNEKSVVANV